MYKCVLYVCKYVLEHIYTDYQGGYAFTYRGSPHKHNIQYFRCNICDTIFEIHTSNKFNTEILKNKREKKIRKGEVNCL